MRPSFSFLKQCFRKASTGIEKQDHKAKLGGFAKAFAAHSEVPRIEIDQEVPFVVYMRNSKFLSFTLPPVILAGTIVQVVDNDLYVDFGWKFNCVCRRPKTNPSAFVPGVKVLIKAQDLELSTRFLGSEKELTLLEADAKLLAILE